MATGDSNNAVACTTKAGATAEDPNTSRPTFSRSMKRYFSSFTRPRSTTSSRRTSQHSNSGSSTLSSSTAALTPEDSSQAATARMFAIWDADDYIRDFVDGHWSPHAAYIKVDCDITLDELHAVGRLPQAEGSRACRRLIRTPAIHEEVALSLWEHLAAHDLAAAGAGAGAGAGDSNSRDGEASRVHPASVHSKPPPSNKREVAKRYLRKWTAAYLRFPLSRHHHQQQPQAQQQQGSPHPTAGKIKTCPFCSGSCSLVSSAVPAHQTPPQPPHQHHHHHHQQQQQQEKEEEGWEAGFWQREEPRVYLHSRCPHFSSEGEGEPRPQQEHTQWHSHPSAAAGGAAGPCSGPPPEAEKGGWKTRRERTRQEKTGEESGLFRLAWVMVAMRWRVGFEDGLETQAGEKGLEKGE